MPLSLQELRLEALHIVVGELSGTPLPVVDVISRAESYYAFLSAKPVPKRKPVQSKKSKAKAKQPKLTKLRDVA